MYLLHITYTDGSDRWLAMTPSELHHWRENTYNANITNIITRYFYSHEWRQAIISSDREAQQLHRPERRDSDDLGGGFA